MPRFIAPRTGAPEVTLAEEQEEYAPLTVAVYRDTSLNTPILLARLTFSDKERLLIAEGEDLYIGQLTFGHPFTPLRVLIGPGYFKLADEAEGGEA